jgi:hypothetical protein
MSACQVISAMACPKLPNPQQLSIRNFSTGFGNGSISGSGSISDLSQPDVSFNIDASFLLEEMAQFYKPANIKQIAGRIKTVFSAKGRLNTPVKWNIEELNKMDLNGLSGN